MLYSIGMSILPFLFDNNYRKYRKSGLKEKHTFEDFLYYRMQEMTPDEQKEIMTIPELEAVELRLNEDAYRHIFNDKRDFHKYFGKYVIRKVLLLDEVTFEEYFSFLKEQKKIIVKPPDLYAGTGVELRYFEDGLKIEEVKHDFETMKKAHYLAEEWVVQHEQYASVYALSLNTIRVTTMIGKDGIPFVFAACNQFGSEGGITDNNHQNGIWAVTDIENGVITDVEINPFSGKLNLYHPDTNVPILGFQNACWDEVKQIALEAAKEIPECRMIGWDIAVRKDGSVEIIEGNVTPELDLFQAITKKGFRSFFEAQV